MLTPLASLKNFPLPTPELSRCGSQNYLYVLDHHEAIFTPTLSPGE